MQWINKIGRICCLNLLHRTDRLLEFTEQMEKYEIPFERVSAIYDEQEGARGLRDTIVNLFNEEIAKGTKSVLVFEDDAHIVQYPHIFHDVMNKIFEQVPDNYHQIFLGGQPTANHQKMFSKNLFKAMKYFATHSVIYSLQGMKEVIARGLEYPIDNDMVEKIQPLGQCYAVLPLLCSQRVGFSDIGKRVQDWTPFIDMRYKQKFTGWD